VRPSFLCCHVLQRRHLLLSSLSYHSAQHAFVCPAGHLHTLEPHICWYVLLDIYASLFATTSPFSADIWYVLLDLFIPFHFDSPHSWFSPSTWYVVTPPYSLFFCQLISTIYSKYWVGLSPLNLQFTGDLNDIYMYV